MIDISKMNNYLVAGLVDNEIQFIVDKCFKQIAEFTKKHMTDESGRLLKGSIEFFDRGIILDFMIEDLYNTIFSKEVSK